MEAPEIDHTVSGDPEVSPKQYMTGMRLWLAGSGLAMSVFLPSVEVSIVSTSLVTITNEFQSYEKISWVVTAYLIAYTGFLVIWSKLCDIVGLKPTLGMAMIIFIAFSAGCGAATSMDQLIIFRALQGMGGAGVYSITTIGFIQMVPPSFYTQITAVASSLMSLGLILGPLLGGAINQDGQWRWVFYMNLPAGALGLIVCLLAFPNHFPNHIRETTGMREKEGFLGWDLHMLRKVDVVGAMLLLGASVLLVTALEEGDVHFAWESAAIICFFVISGILWAAFIAWQCGCFVSGAPITIAVIGLPQRYQIVNLNSPLDAGVKLLAYAAATPVGVVLASLATGKIRIPFVYVLLVGCALQTTGFALLSTLPVGLDTWPGQHGYSVLTGLGTGCTIGTLYMLAPISVDKKDQALAIGTGLQLRMLGGAVGIAAANSKFNSYLHTKLPGLLQDYQLSAVLHSASSIAALPLDLQTRVREVYGEAYNWQMRVTIGFAAAAFLTVPLIWKKQPLRLGLDGTPE
ncbi:hypothetical protein EKO04_001172 [Ascochyta lentis]|uniref:Major facilitator superfamily (MFS) profile domain-containing protein n=1 Tax=Ascochyta lentis TaxID=205686 RepID=A0A8H7JEP5_9PLEO|nr:hypothetical protein EKO04_001172 [Ascochyta lentis]